MILGIDASNIRGGGGITHLKELLASYSPEKYKFNKIIIWACRHTLEQLKDHTWLEKRTHPFLDRNIFFRLYWQRVVANEAFRNSGIDVLFAPGALYYTTFKPLITMSHNMLPFSPEERNRYGKSYMNYRLKLLEKKQGKSFTTADGVIFLTNYAQNAISKRLDGKVKKSKVIAHGIAPQFFNAPKLQKSITEYSKEKPFEFLYVSIIDVYKHQKTLIQAFSQLYEEGFPVRLKLVGPAYPQELKLFQEELCKISNNKDFIEYLGAIPYTELQKSYHDADAFVFASTCENLPNILIEAMASGLPIACSKYGPMPEVLQNAGIYFDPLNVDETADVIRELIENPEIRKEFSQKAYLLAKQFSWEKCADETFKFLGEFV